MANPEKVITRELVFETADRLKANGIEPSNRKLLHELGGSMTTIAGFFRDWKAHQDIAAPVPGEAVEIPGAVADAGKRAIAAIWQACADEAKREIDAIIEQANQRVRDAESDRDKVLAELAEAEAEISAEKERTASLTADVAQLVEQNAGLRNMNEQLAAEAEKVAAVNAEMSRRADQLAEALSHAREEAAAAQAQRDRLAEAERQLMSDLVRKTAEAEHCAAQLETTRAALAELKQKTAETVDHVMRERDAARLEVTEAAAIVSRYIGQITHLETQIMQLERDRNAARQEATDATTAASRQAGQIDALTAQVASQLAALTAAGAGKTAKASRGDNPGT
jgi:chromosome segregation ATPase